MRQVLLRSLVLAGVLAPVSARATGYLVVILDDVGPDKVGAYVGDTYGASVPDYLPDTPNLDTLATIGLRFTNAWTNPVCSPSRASLLTGRYAFEHDVGVIVAPGTPSLATAEVTLPEILADSTYTASPVPSGLFGKWHLGTWSTGGADWTRPGTYADVPNPGEHGFAVFSGTLMGSVESYENWTWVGWPVHGGASVANSTTWAPDVAVDDAVTWISGQSGDWMAVVALEAAHTDDDGTKGHFEPDDLPPFASCTDVDGDGRCSSHEAYVGLVEGGDDRVGRLLEDLEAADPALLEDTVLLVMGDNGTPFGEVDAEFVPRGERAVAGKNSVYESGVRVPLFVARGCDWMDQADGHFDGAYAGVTPACTGTGTTLATPGLAITAPVELMDLFATVGDLAGSIYTPPDSSVSLAPCLAATAADAVDCGVPELSGRIQYAETFYRPYTPASNYGTTGEAASGVAGARLGNFKLVGEIQGTRIQRCMRWEFYNLSTDPYETDDLRAGGSRMNVLELAGYRALRTYIRGTLAPDWMPTRTCPS